MTRLKNCDFHWLYGLQYSEISSFSVLGEMQDSACCFYFYEQYFFGESKAIRKQPSFLLESNYL